MVVYTDFFHNISQISQQCIQCIQCIKYIKILLKRNEKQELEIEISQRYETD